MSIRKMLNKIAVWGAVLALLVTMAPIQASALDGPAEDVGPGVEDGIEIIPDDDDPEDDPPGLQGFYEAGGALISAFEGEAVGVWDEDDLDEALGEIPEGGSGTIILEQSFTYSDELIVNKKSVTFDLNGNVLTVNNPVGSGLSVYGGGDVLLLDPEDGALDIICATLGVSTDAGSKAEVTSVTVNDDTSGSMSTGINTYGSGCEVVVYGDVTLEDCRDATGVSANNGANDVQVTIYGDLAVNGKEYGYGISAGGSALVAVGGDVVVYAQDNASGVYAQSDAQVFVDGCITVTLGGSGTKTGIWAANTAQVTVGEGVSGSVSTSNSSEVTVSGGGVEGDVYAGGGEIDITGGVKGSIYSTGGKIYITGGAEGSVYANDGEVDIAGGVRGNIDSSGVGGLIRVAGKVAGNVSAYDSELSTPDGGKIDITGDVEGFVSSSGSGSLVTIVGKLSANESGPFASNSGKISITGNVTGTVCGAFATTGGDVVINGNVTIVNTAAGANPAGVSASGAGTITVIGDVNVTGGNSGTGIYAGDEGSIVNVSGNVSATGTRAGSQAFGVNAANGGEVSVSGKVSVTAVEGADGIQARDGKVTVGGNVSLKAKYGGGAHADEGGYVTVDGTITPTGGAGYVILGNKYKKQTEYNAMSGGYRIFSDSGNIVRVGNKPMEVQPNVTTTVLPNGAVGRAYTAKLSAAGGAPITWSVYSGSLPGGLTLNAETGVISGTPSAVGEFPFTVMASNKGGAGTKAFTVSIGQTINAQAIGGVTAPVDRADPVKDITATAQYTGTVRWSPKHAPFDFGTEYTAIIELTPAAGYTFIGVPENFFTVAGAESVTNAAGSGVIRAVFEKTDDKTETSISVNPSHVFLTSSDNTATLICDFSKDVGDANYGKIVWRVEDDPDGIVDVSPGSGKFTVVTASTSKLDGLESQKTVRVVAEYDGRYTAAASVELIPDDAGDVTIKALETKVSVNKAKKSGALVPMQITGLSSLAVTGVKLYAAGGSEIAGGELEASVCGNDSRWIEIKAKGAAAKSYNGVRVALVTASGEHPSTNTINITVTETWPKITLKAEQLNMFLTDHETGFSAAAADGSVVEVTKIEYFAPGKDDAVVKIKSAPDDKILTALKAGTANMNVTVDMPDYYTATKNGNVIKSSVKVVYAAPKLKLDKASVALTGSGGGTGIELQSGDKKVKFESYYTVKDVKYSSKNVAGNNANVGISYDDVTKMISVTPTPAAGVFKAGTAILEVTFEESGESVFLNLKVSEIAQSALKASVKTNALTVHKDHAGHIHDVPITLNAANHVPGDWAVKDVDGVLLANSPLDGVIDVDFTGNTMKLKVCDDADLTQLLGDKNADKKYKLNIGAANIKAFPVTLTITQKQPTFKVGVKGKIDIASPGSALSATVTLTNSTSKIKNVTLYDQKIVDKKVVAPAVPNYDFEVYDIEGNTFKIRAAGRDLAPVQKKLSVMIELTNGQYLYSWTAAGKDSPITIKPAQTVGKSFASKKAVTLYKAHPQAGESLELRLTTPDGAKLGAVEVNSASVNAFKDGGFEVVRSGEGEWTIYFKDGKEPMLKNGNKLGAGYNIKLELWAVGTYKMEGGKAVALKEGSAASKPTLVSVKVTIN